MARVSRPDGVELEWEQRGEGPAVVFCQNILSIPDALEPIVDDLAVDHRVITYDMRGTGGSTRSGPYDLRTDVGDLIAVLDVGLGAGGADQSGRAVAVAAANGGAVAAIAATERPDRISSLVAPVGPPVRMRDVGDEALGSSRSVLEAMGTMLGSDYRGAIRAITGLGNPQFDEPTMRERVERQLAWCPQEAAVGRFEAWRDSDTTSEAKGLGDRLWVPLNPAMPWFPPTLAEPLGELLPDAHVEVVEDGPVSRPDITAGVVRRITDTQSDP